MRPQIIVSTVILSLCSLMLTDVVAHAAAPTSRATKIRVAERAVEIAELELRRYERVEYPLQLRRLESQIATAKLRVSMHERLLAEYARFTKDGYSSPLILTLERERLALGEAKLRQGDLEKEKLLLVRYRSDQLRLYMLKLEVAQQNLRVLKMNR